MVSFGELRTGYRLTMSASMGKQGTRKKLIMKRVGSGLILAP
jgi:hypothetical protein